VVIRADGADPVNRFRKRDRVRRGDDFTEIIRRGEYAADDCLVVNVRRLVAGPVDESGGDAEKRDGLESAGAMPSRLGITIPRKTGNAVVRNRWKRWIREAFRTQRSEIPSGLEIIVRPKRDAVGSFEAIRRSLPVTVRRASRKLKPG